MCAPESNAYRTWKGLFLTAEGCLVLACLLAVTGKISYWYYSKNHITWASGHLSVRLLGFCEQWMRPIGLSFVASLLILLLVSPFFMWSPLRRAALGAWIIGFLGFVFAVLFLMSWH
jgi:hypothetical protein